MICYLPDGTPSEAGSAPRPVGVFPGSFNPLHQGHRRLAEVACEWLQGPVHFELSRTNVDKPTLTDAEIQRRVRQFRHLAPIWVTDSPRFLQKALLFPGVTFIIGADTAERLVDPKYADGSEAAMLDGLKLLHAVGCRLLVAGRTNADGQFCCWQPPPTLPARLAALFAMIPEERFRVDLSSSILRQQGFGLPAGDAES
jgi:cytidyltransferase-like protein